MALKKPLVMGAGGEFEELQTGDTIDTQPDTVDRTFTSTAVAGQVLYVDGAGSVDLAQADASGTSVPFGYAQAGVTAASSGTVVIDGTATLTTGQWDTVTGQVGGLTAGSQYYMDPNTAGNILPQSGIDAALTSGEYWIRVGQALSTTEMRVDMQFHRIKKA
jgi:hypothetical protein